MAPLAPDDAAARLASLEAAAWRSRTRLAAASARADRLQTEHDAAARTQGLLVRERQALLAQTEGLRQEVARLTERLDAARDTVALLRHQLRTRFLDLDRLKKERAGLAGLLGRAVSGLFGTAPGAKPSRRALEAAAKTLVRVGLVDPDWYRTAYPDVAASGMDPVRHYLLHGCLEGRLPRDPAGD